MCEDRKRWRRLRVVYSDDEEDQPPEPQSRSEEEPHSSRKRQRASCCSNEDSSKPQSPKCDSKCQPTGQGVRNLYHFVAVEITDSRFPKYLDKIICVPRNRITFNKDGGVTVRPHQTMNRKFKGLCVPNGFFGSAEEAEARGYQLFTGHEEETTVQEHDKSSEVQDKTSEPNNTSDVEWRVVGPSTENKITLVRVAEKYDTDATVYTKKQSSEAFKATSDKHTKNRTHNLEHTPNFKSCVDNVPLKEVPAVENSDPIQKQPIVENLTDFHKKMKLELKEAQITYRFVKQMYSENMLLMDRAMAIIRSLCADQIDNTIEDSANNPFDVNNIVTKKPTIEKVYTCNRNHVESEGLQETDEMKKCDEQEARRTLRFPDMVEGVIELLPGTNIYVRKEKLKRIKEESKNNRMLTSSLLTEIFTDNALRTCALSKLPSGFRRQKPRPLLHQIAKRTLILFVRQVAFEKGWRVLNFEQVTMILSNSLLKEKEKKRILIKEI